MLSKSCELRNDRRNVMLHVTFCKRDKLFEFSKAENVFHPFPTFFKELHCEPKLSDLQWLTFIRCSLGGSLRGNGSEELWPGVCNT